MGYLNSDSVTVDAILTKHGRKLLANGQSLGITQFALSDDGGDYSLYNVDHPSGSAYYDDAITATPQLEAVPDDSVLMRYKLNTLPRNTKFLPYLHLNPSSLVVADQGYVAEISPVTENYQGQSETYQFLITDVSMLEVSLATSVTDLSGIQSQMSQIVEMPYSALYEGPSIGISTYELLGADKTIHMTIFGKSSGAVADMTITLEKNDDN